MLGLMIFIYVGRLLDSADSFPDQCHSVGHEQYIVFSFSGGQTTTNLAFAYLPPIMVGKVMDERETLWYGATREWDHS